MQQVAQRRIVGRHGVQVGGQRGAGHAARIGYAGGAVEAVADVVEVQQRAAVALGIPARGGHQPVDVGVADDAAFDPRIGLRRCST